MTVSSLNDTDLWFHTTSSLYTKRLLDIENGLLGVPSIHRQNLLELKKIQVWIINH
jgi:hypothetical protein